jgi:hypothetical protein
MAQGRTWCVPRVDDPAILNRAGFSEDSVD